MFKNVHAEDGMQVRVYDNGELWEPFPVSNSFKQWCVLTLTLFSIMLSAMPTNAFRDEDMGVSIRYCIGKLFNRKRLKS